MQQKKIKELKTGPWGSPTRIGFQFEFLCFRLWESLQLIDIFSFEETQRVQSNF